MHGCVVVRHGQGQEASQGTTEGVSISLRLPEGSGGCFSLMGSGGAEFYNDSPCHTHTHTLLPQTYTESSLAHTQSSPHTHTALLHMHTHTYWKNCSIVTLV